MRGRERERESETEVFKAKAKENIEHCFYNFGVETKRDETGKRVQLTSKTKEKAKKFLKGCSSSGNDDNVYNDDGDDNDDDVNNDDNNYDNNDGNNDNNDSGSSDGRFVLTKLLTKSFFQNSSSLSEFLFASLGRCCKPWRCRCPAAAKGCYA